MTLLAIYGTMEKPQMTIESRHFDRLDPLRLRPRTENAQSRVLMSGPHNLGPRRATKPVGWVDSGLKGALDSTEPAVLPTYARRSTTIADCAYQATCASVSVSTRLRNVCHFLVSPWMSGMLEV